MTGPSTADGGLPRLGPRAWWTYLAVQTPKTLGDLAATARIAEPSMRAHLRTLEKHGLVRRADVPGRSDAGAGSAQQGAIAGLATYERAVELSPEQIDVVRGRVERANLSRQK